MGKAPLRATQIPSPHIPLRLLTILYPTCILLSLLTMYTGEGVKTCYKASRELTAPLGKRPLILSHW